MKQPQKKPQQPTRRTFIKTALSAGATFTALTHFGCAQPGGRAKAGAAVPQKPHEGEPKLERPTTRTAYSALNIAYIGTAGIGRHHLETTVPLGVNCPCFCDVDTKNFTEVAALFPDARRYQDYRQMLEKEQKHIDAVMIGTPDHHHYPATILAMQLGKHVYTQKPLTHTPWEARQLTEAARKYKLATQMGNQGHALEGWRLVYEWIHSGALGQIKEVHTWTNRPIWPQGIGRPEGEDQVPPNLDWDVWLGPAPLRPYKGPTPPARNGPYHQFNWRGWWDFGAGALGDMACHTMDGMWGSLEPGYPTAIEPLACTPVNAESFPKSAMIKWEFPAKGDRAAFVAYWYDGGLHPPMPPDLEFGRNLPDTGNLFLGTKAALLVSGDYSESPRVIPEAKLREIGKPKQLLERSPGHVEEWLMAVAGTKPIDYPGSNFAYSGPFTEAVLLGNIALRVGRRLEWDGANLKFTNLPEANQYVSKEYRAGWKF